MRSWASEPSGAALSASRSAKRTTSPSTVPPGLPPSAVSTSGCACLPSTSARSEEHTSELQSLMRISYAVFCLKKKTHKSKPKYEEDIYDHHQPIKATDVPTTLHTE